MKPPFRLLNIHHIIQVDKVLGDSCAVDGDYCKFNKKFLDLLKKLESEKWFEEFSLINGEADWVYNKKKGKYDRVKSPAPFLKVDWISNEVIWELIKQVADEYDKNRAISTTDRLIQKLETFNFGTDFVFKRRRRRQAGKGKGKGGGGEGEEVELTVAENYTNINTNIKRFITAVNIILPKLKGEGRKRRQAGGGGVDCESVSNMAGILGMEDGGVREGDMFSYARIKVSLFFNEMLPIVEWMAQQDLTECKKIVDKKYVYMLEVNLQKLQTFLDVKERSTQFKDRIR